MPRRRATILVAALLLAACSSRPAAAPRPRTLAAACASAVTSWARALATAEPRTSFDYQEMGLSDAQYDVLRAVIVPGRSPAPLSAQEAAAIDQRCLAHYGPVASTAPRRTGHTWPAG